MSNKIRVTYLRATIRFVKGYRYLDRCGEAMVRVEELDEHWVPGEVSPTKCVMNNFKLGLKLTAQSEFMQVEQTEFISLEHFQDQTCRIYETLWKLFGVQRVLTPGLGIKLRIPCRSTEEAESLLQSLKLSTIDAQLLRCFDDEVSATRLVFCTEKQIDADGVPVVRRRRMEAGVLRQLQQPDFDSRVIQRLPLIPFHQRESMAALMAMRRRHSVEPTHAVEFDLENSHEQELDVRTFDLASFIEDSAAWSDGVKDWLQTRQRELR
jgi:hypothetical protein